jgi:hypothetical protein
MGLKTLSDIIIIAYLLPSVPRPARQTFSGLLIRQEFFHASAAAGRKRHCYVLYRCHPVVVPYSHDYG